MAGGRGRDHHKNHTYLQLGGPTYKPRLYFMRTHSIHHQAMERMIVS